jgi:hypothetical protein
MNEPILQINRRIHEKNLVEILGPMVQPLGGSTWNVPTPFLFFDGTNFKPVFS